MIEDYSNSNIKDQFDESDGELEKSKDDTINETHLNTNTIDNMTIHNLKNISSAKEY